MESRSWFSKAYVGIFCIPRTHSHLGYFSKSTCTLLCLLKWIIFSKFEFYAICILCFLILTVKISTSIFRSDFLYSDLLFILDLNSSINDLWHFLHIHNLPHKDAHKISELNLFLYFLISGVSDIDSCVCAGVTLTLICDPRRDWLDCEPTVDPLLAPKPKAEKDLWCRIEGVLLTAWRYCKRNCQ